jgi:hypothetical protein
VDPLIFTPVTVPVFFVKPQPEIVLSVILLPPVILILPLPKIEVPLIVLMFVPLTNLSYLLDNV